MNGKGGCLRGIEYGCEICIDGGYHSQQSVCKERRDTLSQAMIPLKKTYEGMISFPSIWLSFPMKLNCAKMGYVASNII